MHPDFDLPSLGGIKGRSSSITAAFIQAIVPVIEPTDAEVDDALRVLGMRRGVCVCAYCGDTRSEWDHFRPLVEAQRPTGYITELANLVPSCGKCNQSKGNKSWRGWIVSEARRSPKSRGIRNLDQRIVKLEDYERWAKPTKIDFEKLVGEVPYKKHWTNWEQLLKLMNEAQAHAQVLREVAMRGLTRKRTD